MAFITIYITNESEEQAEKIAAQLLSMRLIACANIYPIKSMYWWKGKMVNEREWVALIKTKMEKWEELKSAIEKIHPYEVPCIMKSEVEANSAYEEWIENSVNT